MPKSWRIVKKKRAAAAFTGEGAAENGGRWNSQGVPIVYTSATQALAALELYIHLNPPVDFELVVIGFVFDEELVERIEPDALPKNWRAEPPTMLTKQLGDIWVKESRSAVLAVPSVIIPIERNYLFNPAHPGFKKVHIGEPEKFGFDPRLLARVR
jgi:RES domain-containing protein